MPPTPLRVGLGSLPPPLCPTRCNGHKTSREATSRLRPGTGCVQFSIARRVQFAVSIDGSNAQFLLHGRDAVERVCGTGKGTHRHVPREPALLQVSGFVVRVVAVSGGCAEAGLRNVSRDVILSRVCLSG